MVGLFTSIDAALEVSRQNLMWMAAMPLLSVWSFQLDGIFIGVGHERHAGIHRRLPRTHCVADAIARQAVPQSVVLYANPHSNFVAVLSADYGFSDKPTEMGYFRALCKRFLIPSIFSLARNIPWS